MADTKLLPAAPFGVPASGRFGRTDGEPGVRVRMLDNLSISLIQPFAGKRAALGFDIPDAGTARTAGGTTLAWAGPNALLAISAAPGHTAKLEAALGDTAAVIDQSGGRVVFRIAGPKARAVLEKGLTIDLHPKSFAPGRVALTQLSHLSVQIIQLDETPTFDVVISRAFAGELWHWLEESAGEYGLDLRDDRN